MGLATILMAAGTAVEVAGNLAQGQSTYESGMYQSQVAKQNRDIAAAEGEYQMEQTQLKTAARVGEITAAQGASGLDVNKGSAPQVRQAAQEVGALDALTIRNDAARKAYGFQLQSTALEKSAKDARNASYFNALGTLVGGAGNIATKGNFGTSSGSSESYNPASWVTWGM